MVGGYSLFALITIGKSAWADAAQHQHFHAIRRLCCNIACWLAYIKLSGQ